MPPSRIHGRYSIGRRPSAFASPASDLIRPGIYGASPSPRSVTFAPNVTPGTYKDPDDLTLDTVEDVALLPDAQLFPPSEQPANVASKRRAPPGKRRSLGYIPRPPNAFMLFRADFVRQKHVPGSIETNHGSLSKIIGNCWRALPLEEKRIWEIKAKQEKEAHSKRYPGYRFRPVHNKDKAKKKEKPLPTPEDERRCEEVAQLLLEGMKGDELAAAIRKLDEKKTPTPQSHLQVPHQHQPFYPPRRPSSVPLPDSRFHPIAVPSLPFFGTTSRSTSPVGNISRNARMIIGQRRPSSALPHFGRTSWGVLDDIPVFPSGPVQGFFPPPQQQHSLQDESTLPMYDTTLFEESFNFGFPAVSGDYAAATFNAFSNLPPHAASGSPPSYDLAPMSMDSISSDLSLSMDCLPTTAAGAALDSGVLTSGVSAAASWSNIPTGTTAEYSTSGPSSVYSGSPARSELSLPLVAPRPQHVPSGMTFNMWHDATCMSGQAGGVAKAPGHDFTVAGLLQADEMHMPVPVDMFFDGAFAMAGLDAF